MQFPRYLTPYKLGFIIGSVYAILGLIILLFPGVKEISQSLELAAAPVSLSLKVVQELMMPLSSILIYFPLLITALINFAELLVVVLFWGFIGALTHKIMKENILQNN